MSSISDVLRELPGGIRKVQPSKPIVYTGYNGTNIPFSDTDGGRNILMNVEERITIGRQNERKSGVKILKQGEENSLQLLFTMLPALPDTEGTIARYILLHPAEAKSMTAKDLVLVCGVGEATVFRLCQRLGCTFSELKRGIQSDAGNPLLLKSPDSQDVRDIVDFASARIRYALSDTMAFVDQASIEAALDILKSAKRIFVCGTGPISGSVAEITAFKFQEAGLTAIPWSDNRPPETVTNICAERDAILGISHSGESIELGKMLELVKNTAVKTIVITNYLSSTAGMSADLVLATAVRERAIHQSDLVPRLGQLFVVEVLIEALRQGRPRIAYADLF